MSQTTTLAVMARRPVLLTGAAVLVLLLCFVFLGGQFAAQGLRISIQESTEASNRTLTRVFVNENWEGVKPLLPPPGSGAEAAKANPNIAALDQIVRAFSRQTDVLKVKIYDRGGMTVYSSDRAQIGEDKARNMGFQTAARGGVASELTYRGKFGAFDGELYDRNLVSTYVPVRVGDDIVAVLEIYADRTDSIEFTNRALRELALSMLPWVVLALLLMSGLGWWLHRSHRALLRALQAAEQRALLHADSHASVAHPPLGQTVPALFADVPQLLDRLQPGGVGHSMGMAGDAQHVDALARDEAVQALVRKLDALAQWAAVTDDLTLCFDRKPSQPQQIDLNALFDRVLTAAKARATRQGVEISSYRHPEALQAVTGDTRLWQAGLGHLLGVALDTTSQGTIQVKVQQSGTSLRVDVVDTGAGVSQSTIDAWTAAWDEKKTWPEPAAEGLVGQRLLLARALVQRAGGSFEARSVPSHGSRWTAQWSLAPEAATVAEPRSTSA